MQRARIATEGGPRYAVARGDGWAVVEEPFATDLSLTGEVVPRDGAHLLAPVEPVLVVGIAHNKALRDHALPMQAWLKSPREVVGPSAPIVRMRDIGQVNVEGELAVVMAREARHLTLENALDHVLGYTIGNDVTNLGRVPIDEKNFEPKAGENYMPIGPWVETDISDPDSLAITVSINGEVRAESGAFNLQSGVAECLVYVTRWLTLGPGDVVLTGAPATFLPVEAGDAVAITIDRIGTLDNPVI